MHEKLCAVLPDSSTFVERPSLPLGEYRGCFAGTLQDDSVVESANTNTRPGVLAARCSTIDVARSEKGNH